MRILLLTTLVVALAGCGTSEPDGEPTPSPSTSAAPSPDAEPTATGAPVPTVDLSARVPRTDVGGGWALESCDPGDAPIVCVFRDGERVGTFEHGQFDLASLPALAEALDTDPPAEALADDLVRNRFFENAAEDRDTNCEGSTVDPQLPTPATVAGQEGITYGYVVTSTDGEVREEIRGWQVVNDTSVFVVTLEGLGPRTCIPSEAPALTLEQYGAFEPVMAAVVAGLTLPEPLPAG